MSERAVLDGNEKPSPLCSSELGGCAMSQEHRSLGKQVRSDFPFFGGDRDQESSRIAFLDSAASALKPQVVVDRMSHYLLHEHANIHRGAYKLSADATAAYDLAKLQVAQFLSAPSASSIIFTRGTTEGINLLAHSFGERLEKGDRVLLTTLEHHSNIVPWQLLEMRRGVGVSYADIRDDAALDLADLFAKLRQEKPKLLSITAVSNAFGTIIPLEKIIPVAREVGALVHVDAAQGIVHFPLDVQSLDIDFLTFSGHKIYGPTGIGVLYGKPELLEAMPPYQGGGDMIHEVTLDGSTWAESPRKFEAGTPAIAEAIGLGEALAYVTALGRQELLDYESQLFEEAFELLSREPGVTLYGPATSIQNERSKVQTSILPFTVEGVHPHDISTIADSFGVQIRAGHHCAMPALRRLGIQSTGRASIGAYTILEDFELLCEAIRRARKTFQ